MKQTLMHINDSIYMLFKPDLKMKLSYILFIISLVQIHATSYGQPVKVDIDLENVTIETVFNHIEKNTDYSFLYNIKDINLSRKVSVNAYNEALQIVLSKLFSETNVEFKILDSQIVLRVPKEKRSNVKLRKAVTQKAIQQQISGRVVDENNLPLPGVTIVIKGTQKGVVTDFDGGYTLAAQEGAILVFKYLGYLDKEVLVTSEVTYDVKMEPSSMELDQVVISTGYQTITKERATGAFGSVSNKVLETKIDQNILSKITSETPGLLQDNNEGFLIRGSASINAATNPLIVVDGIRLGEGVSVSDINPNDVKSITVLKDAASASIWGIDAANGVIVIVTKKGKRDSKTSVEASFNSSITSKLDIFDTNIAGASTQINYQRALFEAQDGFFQATQLFSGPSDEINSEKQRQFFQLNPVAEALIQFKAGNINQGQLNSRLNDLSLLDARKEYSDNVLRQVVWNQYNLAVSGGSDKQDFRASLTFNNNESGVRGEEAKQFILNLRNSLDISSKVKARFIANFSQTKRDNRPEQLNDNLSYLGVDPISPQGFLSSVPIASRLLDDSGNYIPQIGGANQGFSDLLQSKGIPYPFTYNVLQEYDNANNRVDDLSLRLQAALDFEITKDLDLSVIYRYSVVGTETRNLFNENTFATRSRVNLLAQIDPVTNRVNDTETDYFIPKGSILQRSFFRAAAHTFRAQFNFDKSFNDRLHQITAIAGYEVSIDMNKFDSNRVYGLDEESLIANSIINFKDLFTNYLADAPLLNREIRIPAVNNMSKEEQRRLSYYVNTAYTYNDKYTFSGSIRLDDISLLGASDEFRNDPQYSLGFKWAASQDLFKDSNVIDFLDVRASYGANSNIGSLTAGNLLLFSQSINNGVFTNRYSNVDNIPNDKLQLEKVKKANLGFDFGLFNNSISGSIDVYQENSVALLAPISFNPTIGINSQEVNAGELTNRGVDVELNFDVLNSDNFSYQTSLFLSMNKNELTKVESEDATIGDYLNGSVTVKGESLSTIYSYRYAGLNGSEGSPEYYQANGNIVNTGLAIADLTNEGTRIPIYYGSWINNLNYKNLSLRVLTNFKAGHVFRYNNRFIPGQAGDIVNVTKDFNNRWKVPGDETQTSIPAIPNFENAGTDVYRNYRFVDTFVDDASHIRLSQINLGYSLPSSIVEKIGFDSFKLSFQVDNVAVWNFNKWDVDPESQFFPLRRTFSFNINTRF